MKYTLCRKNVQVELMETNWVARQALQGIAQFDQAMVDTYPEANESLQSARNYLATIGDICNYLTTAEGVPWESYLPPNSKVLDLGCGGGWLTAMLSQFNAIKTIYALDSSKYFLHKMLPQVMQFMGGDTKKLIAIEGLFSPLFFEDGHLDIVVASSALHHADNLESVLREIRRCIKPGGRLFVLNETPWPGYRHWVSVMAAAGRICWNLMTQRYMPISPSISTSGYLYDPKLGDRDYPLWYWQKALETASFSVEQVIDTKLPTVKGSKGRPLIHFICLAV